MSKISIIVPIYNAERHLSKCIKSIMEQTFKDFELILVNDGSTDKSLEICNKYANNDNRIRVISKENEGSVLARKNGIDEAKSEYVTFVDADDWISKDTLKVIDEEINKNNSDVIVFNYYRVFKSLTTIKRKNKSFYFEREKNIYENEEVKNELVTAYFHGHPFPANLWGKVYKRECLNLSNKYLKNIKFLGEDFHMNIEIMLNVKKVSLINQYLYFYRMGGYTSKYMPYFFNDITEGYKAQKAVLNEYFCEEEHHYGGISIMLLNTFKTLIYNMFLSDLSSNEILNKIAEYLDDDQIKEASKNQEAINYFNKFDANYLKAVNNKDNYYLYEITKKVFKRNKYKRIIQNIL